MHEPIANHVEDYLTRSLNTRLPVEFTAHLMHCAPCRVELTAMERQSNAIRVLRPRNEPEPAPGFYARVLERIEAQRPISVWAIFLQPFGRRLAMASFALALLLGVYIVSSEPGPSSMQADNPVTVQAMLPGEDQPAPRLGAGTDQDRMVVLVNLATYQQ